MSVILVLGILSSFIIFVALSPYLFYFSFKIVSSLVDWIIRYVVGTIEWLEEKLGWYKD